MGSPVVTGIFLVLRLGIGVILFRLALNPRYRNLHWLAAVFYLNFVNLFLRGPDLGMIAQVVMIVIQICLALFTHTTFYQHRRSPVGWVIGGLVVAGGASLYLSRQAPTYFGTQPMHLMCAVNWLWHALAAWKVWRALRPDGTVEDWIKARYAMVVTYAALMGALFLTLPLWLIPMPFIHITWQVTMMVALVLQYLAWGMPAFLRRRLNRNYRPSAAAEQAQSMTEEDALRALEREP
ncbi:MAG: hypothetical protein JXO72_05760 [Vicinamibacteria bacterium]|nr:hypothetical protein [Vicinamibacteria bacterium]